LLCSIRRNCFKRDDVAYQLCDGYSINTDFFTVSAQLRGVFGSPTEAYDLAKHNILFQFNLGEKLRAEITTIGLKIRGLSEAFAAILQVKDLKSESLNDVLTPERKLKISGYKLKIARDSNQWYFLFQYSHKSQKRC